MRQAIQTIHHTYRCIYIYHFRTRLLWLITRFVLFHFTSKKRKKKNLYIEKKWVYQNVHKWKLNCSTFRRFNDVPLNSFRTANRLNQNKWFSFIFPHSPFSLCPMCGIGWQDDTTKTAPIYGTLAVRMLAELAKPSETNCSIGIRHVQLADSRSKWFYDNSFFVCLFFCGCFNWIFILR